ncbi:MULTISPECIES: RNA-guided endonuclease TnpB family protein [Streptomyces]|uniref:RNA-guided endonuclease TnpB family protein n=1 Tax=Streptomyces mirabilis TaxID=68239 RepID=A0ABU3V3G7_9ACTN|nr:MULTISPECIES: RNA-guided endonuclease TnpB family protein [Streptomyces]MCX4615453.1 transposase [Streptomyces mirabilis]MCX5355989.1 transposase [Streptomyces mirabilis]MDU9000726.1 RNA-guided endonuclease TnpB family protein [Streptomyces mirabilis]QDN84722.1 IS200/IS605 family element transposase accessory protein TnpB [Streptomyces sp. RLB3-6]QDO05586.1 IS200/IS605 family element transposase accessory protein TnpB [Streptomyces sp. S1D4-23]
MAIHVKRAYRYRFCPTDAQAAEPSRTFGCVRKVYNMALAARTEAWARQERVNYNQSSAMLTAWKKTGELAFLDEVSSVPLQQALRHLQGAFANFFSKRARYPRFKSKRKSRAAAEYTSSAFTFRDGRLKLAKMAGPLDIVWSRPLPEGSVPTTVTVSRDAAGRWFVSMLCDDPTVKPLAATDAAVGIDVGLDHLLALSTGEKIANPRHERRDRDRLATAQRHCARKEKGSANREKARRKVARIHARITDRRRDGLHKLTTRLVRENQTLVIEDLTVRNMVRNRKLARAISDAAWAEFRSLLEYKAAWYGRDVVVVDRFFPSSKLCSHCGALQDRMPLHVRTWTCDCGTVHDRDVNAAKNLLAAGLAVSVCGAGVRPQRSTPDGQSATKQKIPRREP